MQTADQAAQAVQIPAEAATAAAQAGITQMPPATARQMYQAARSYRDVLGQQLNKLTDKRNDITRELTNEETKGIDRTGLEARLKDIDARILDMDKQIAVADQRQALAAGVPGATIDPPQPRRNGPDPDGVMAGGAMLLFALSFPFVIAYSRRIWRRSAKMTVTLPPEVAGRMQAMEEAIESVAVEVERIGEGQRFMTQALSESPRHLGAGVAEPVMVRAREAVPANRPL